eukprot:gnl/MRDRNA2_/MRDRNA2_83627_c0_seq1.p1 gnl/MRDRNA2_/MRDRNA2_83627_c0~~gnl/MRDRNA2_/MRDRNA2_83627_c0_seq1.p1  ORF type:complete len:533 (+),score=125.06 gnl/MRDRNA2_/MRDRNA2_83627_c0_seq1:91-1689(+)
MNFIEDHIRRLILENVAPYVDGINTKKLKVEAWSGEIVLKKLKVKKEIFAMFGITSLELHKGKISKIQVIAPLHQLHEGKVKVVVETLELVLRRSGELEGKSDEEVIAEMRETKEKAIEARLQQLRDSMELGDVAQKGLGGSDIMDRILRWRKLINNIEISVKDVRLKFVDKQRSFGVGILLPMLHVQNASEISDDEPVKTDNEDSKERMIYQIGAVNKALKIEKLGAYLMDLPKTKPETAEEEEDSLDLMTWLLKPLSLLVQAAYQPPPSWSIGLKLKATEENSKESGFTLIVKKSQLQIIFDAVNEVVEEGARRTKLLDLPEELANASLDQHEELQTEYKGLHTSKLGSPLSETAQRRLQLIEAAVPVKLLAKWRLEVQLDEELKEKGSDEKAKEQAKLQERLNSYIESMIDEKLPILQWEYSLPHFQINFIDDSDLKHQHKVLAFDLRSSLSFDLDLCDGIGRIIRFFTDEKPSSLVAKVQGPAQTGAVDLAEVQLQDLPPEQLQRQLQEALERNKKLQEELDKLKQQK